jgi:hypothetical protein
MFDVPVLFLIFNRHQESIEVFRRIKEVKPRFLYISGDGPRDKVEKEKIEIIRKDILSQINWKCEIKTLFRENNLGCKEAVNSAINWFFDNEEQGIILEDDCLPDISFFHFCSIMLNKYALDNRIMMVSGNNNLGLYKNSDSYLFSRIGSIWGWATWRRAWELNKDGFKYWDQIRESNYLFQLFKSKLQAIFRTNVFNKTNEGEINTWDYTWTYNRIVNNGLSIVPNKNLITNIGFGSESTHTRYIYFDNRYLQRYEINNNSINHPEKMIIDFNYDNRVFKEFTMGGSINMMKLIIKFYLFRFFKLKL